MKRGKDNIDGNEIQEEVERKEVVARSGTMGFRARVLKGVGNTEG